MAIYDQRVSSALFAIEDANVLSKQDGKQHRVQFRDDGCRVFGFVARSACTIESVVGSAWGLQYVEQGCRSNSTLRRQLHESDGMGLGNSYISQLPTMGYLAT